MSYQIQILSDKEFETLPFPETDVSLGIADPKTNTAYVRYTRSGELNKYLVNHELEHLIEGHGGEHSDHYRNGVYYKGFGDAFSGIGQAVMGAGQSLGGAMGNIGGLGSSLGQAAMGAGRSIGGGISNLAGSLGKAMNFGGGFQGGANTSGGMAAAAASNPALRSPAVFGGGTMPSWNLGGNAAQGALNSGFQMPTALSQFKNTGFGGQGASGSLNQPAPSISRKMTTAPMGISAEVGQGAQPTQPQTQQGGDFFKNASSAMDLGQQVMSMFQGSQQGGMQQGYGSGIQMPDPNQLPSVQALKGFNFRDHLMDMDPALQDAMNRDFDKIDAQEQHDFRNRWKNVRPGADIENDSVFARDYKSLQDSQAIRRTDAMAKYRKEMITTNLAINDKEYDQLESFADMDIQTLMFNTQLSFIEANQLKRIFGRSTEQDSITQSDVPRDEGGALGAVGKLIQQGRGVYNQAQSLF